MNNNESNGLVIKREYFEFIKSNKNYSSKQKEYFVWYFENIGKQYTSKKSNKQIHSFVNLVYFSGDIDKISKADILFQKFARTNFKQVVREIKFNKLVSDDDVLKYIHKINKTKHNRQKSIYDDDNDDTENNTKNDYYVTTHKTTKEISRYSNKLFTKPPERNDWKYMTDNIVFKLKSLTNIPNNPNNLKYLDIGCGDGKKTKIFGHYLGIEQSNIHGCDISTWGPYESDKQFGFNFSLIKSGKLNYDDSTFDIITTILTLHHVEHLDNFINEIVRVLKPGGFLILIEHNIYDDIEAMLIDIQHLFYGAFMDNNLDFVKNDIFTKCYNQMEWDHIFAKYEMINLHNDTLYPQLENRLRYDNLYYGIFKKNEQNVTSTLL